MLIGGAEFVQRFCFDKQQQWRAGCCAGLPQPWAVHDAQVVPLAECFVQLFTVSSTGAAVLPSSCSAAAASEWAGVL
jgi:hypothetical protein